MSNPLASVFNDLHDWSVFQAFLKDMGDYDRLDSVAVMERVMPIFKAYAEATRPRILTRDIGGKRSNMTAAHYVFCTGLSDRGTFGYRIVRVSHPDQFLDIIDIDRMMDDTELFKARSLERRSAQLQSMARNIEPRLRLTLDKGFKAIKRTLKNGARFVETIDFLHATDPAAFQDFTSARTAIIREMMQSIEDLLEGNDSRTEYVRKRLLAGLEDFDHEREALNRQFLTRAKQGLNGDVLKILARNPSALSCGHYRWLMRDNPDCISFRRQMVDACPIILLIDDYQDHIGWLEGREYTAHSAIAALFRSWDMKDGVAFYCALREDMVGKRNAAWLMDTAEHIKDWRDAKLPLASAADWDRLSSLVIASREYAQVLGANGQDLFRELAHEVEQEPGFINTDPHARARELADMRMLRDRIAAFGLAPKLITEARIRGFDLPASHALFIAGNNMVHRDVVAGMPRRMVEAVHHFNKRKGLISAVLFGTSIRDMRSKAFNYATHYGEQDRLLRNLMITNRLAENAAEYAWHPLPSVEMRGDGYVMTPHNTQADLLKLDIREGTETWRQAPLAITDGTHFVSMRRRGGITDAVIIIEEPAEDSDPWRIKDLIPTGEGRLRNHLYAIAEAYLRTPDFLDQVDLAKIRKTRAALYSILSSRASEQEMLGRSNLRHPEELNILIRHWPGPGAIGVDEYGCITNDYVDQLTGLCLDTIEPFYQKTPGAAPALLRGLRPAP